MYGKDSSLRFAAFGMTTIVGKGLEREKEARISGFQIITGLDMRLFFSLFNHPGIVIPTEGRNLFLFIQAI